MAATDLEARLLAGVSTDTLWQNASTLARWIRVSGTPDERPAVEYLRQRLEDYGVETHLYEFESLLGWPEEAVVEVRSPETGSLKAITHSLAPSTPPDGLEGDVVYLGRGKESDFAARPAAGKIVLLDGIAEPDQVLLAQQQGAAALIFASYDDYARDMCVSPVWGTPTRSTAGLMPSIPVFSVARAEGSRLKALLAKGPVRVWLRARTFLGWRKVPVLVGEIAGTAEPDKYVLFSGHYCSWYHGAMDNGTANATMLEVARILSANRRELRRSVKFAFWPGHTQGRYSGSAWFADEFWEDLHDNCVLHVNVDSTGARGATLYSARCMEENRAFALAAVRDAAGGEATPTRMPRAGDQSFWSCGISSVFMSLSKVPPELACDLDGHSLAAPSGEGDARPPTGGMPWYWHTADDTIDKIDPEVLQRDTRIFLLAVLRSAASPILPLRYGAAVREIREALELYKSQAGDRFDLGPVLSRAVQLQSAVAALDELLDRACRTPGRRGVEDLANRGLLALSRALVTVNYTANGPFDQDLAISIPRVPLLAHAARLSGMDPAADETRFLVTELTRNRNKVAYFLREALRAADETAAGLRGALA
ncbi:MAG TPA: M28 family metallopeptidase [Chloroflexota bacterium]